MTHTKDEALKLAQEALEETLRTLDDANATPGGPIADTIWYSQHETLFDYLAAQITAIKQALAAPTVQKPDAWCDEDGMHYRHGLLINPGLKLYTTPPAQPAPVQEPTSRLEIDQSRVMGLADLHSLECLEDGTHIIDLGGFIAFAADVLRIAVDAQSKEPAQPAPVQEPVAWALQEEDGQVYDCICNEEHDRHEGGYTVPLYTAPPAAQRQWVGLTDEEYSQLHDGLYQQGKSLGWVVDQVEAKLKAKNAA